MSIFTYIEAIPLTRDNLLSLRIKELSAIERKLKTKALFNKQIHSKEISRIIDLLRYNSKELSTYYQPAFFALRKLIEEPTVRMKFEIKHLVAPFVTEKLKQFTQTNFGEEFEEIFEHIYKERNFNVLHLFMNYWEIIPPSLQSKILQWLEESLSDGLDYLKEGKDQGYSASEMLYDLHFFNCLSLLSSNKVEEKVLEMAQLINSRFLQQENSSETVLIAFSVSSYESENEELSKLLKYLKQRSEDKGAEESAKNKAKIKRERNYKKSSNYSGNRSYDSDLDWKSFLIYGGLAITLIRGCYSFVKSQNSSNDSISAYYPTEEYDDFRSDGKTMMRTFINQAIHIQTAGEINRSSPIRFSKREIVFYPRPKSSQNQSFLCSVKNSTDKKAVFVFYRASGYDFILLEPFETERINRKFKYFAVFKGKEPLALSYNARNRERTYGFGFNKFDDFDLKVLSTVYELTDNKNPFNINSVTINDDFVEIK